MTNVSARESLELLVGGAGWESKAFASAEVFLSQTRVLGPSCLVLDIALPHLSGLDLLKRLAAGRSLRIIFVAAYGDVPMSIEAMKGRRRLLRQTGRQRSFVARGHGVAGSGLLNKQVGAELGAAISPWRLTGAR
jgi:CheY-like chemotaxis protein